MHRLHVVSLAATFAAAVALGAGACKGKTEVVDSPDTLAALDECRSKVKDQDELRALLEKEIADLKLGSTTDGEQVVVSIEGDVLTVTAGKSKGPYQGDPKGDAKDEALYAEFVKAVKKSRGSIKKCYTNALKKNSQLQARTVKLDIQVNFKTSGSMSSATFNPRISETFDQCMTNVASGWKLPAAPRKVAFQYQMSLTPE
jgi:hypothetical protein